MNATISTLLCTTVLFALGTDGAAQKSGRTGTRTPVEVSGPVPSACGHVACAQGVIDYGTDRCIKASSTPTFGLLFPYPGINNTFVGPAFVGGGEDNQATGQWATIGGGRNNTASGFYTTVSGGTENMASGTFATVGGGRSNRAYGFGATVSGGGRPQTYHGNIASGYFATVGGGGANIAGSTTSTVGGGFLNQAQGDYATVGGGIRNDASGRGATVAGGGGYGYYESGNSAPGDYSAVPGGALNDATGDYSFAAGRRAKANHDGSFVWGDSIDADKPSSTADEFNVYASGGVRMFTNSAATTGAALAAGSGTWSMLSDRDAKEHIEPVDAQAILEGVVAMPLSTWNYTEQSDTVRHMGPMAQDFHAAFGLGVSDKLIDAVDADGVALAAIQGLHAEVQELRATNAELVARLERLEALAMAK